MLFRSTRTKPASLTVHRFRQRPVGSESFPVQLVYFHVDPDPKRRATRTLDRTLDLAVEHLVKPAAGVPADDAVDPLINWAVLALFSDETLGFANGVVGPITEKGTVWEPKEGEQSFMRAITVFSIQYRTKDNDPEAAP